MNLSKFMRRQIIDENLHSTRDIHFGGLDMYLGVERCFVRS